MFLRFFGSKILFTTAIMTAFFVAGNAFAEITKIVFTTEPQNITSGQISGAITVQLQDPSGTEQKATETTYLNISSSNTGEISSSKDSWKVFSTLPSDFSTSSIYISTNSANRTFYYKGLVSGEHNITVTAKSKSGKVYDSILQIIGVDLNSGSATTTDTTSTSTQATSTTQTSTSTNSNIISQTITNTVIRYVSVHSSPEDLSSYSDATKFEISAGRERVGYVGTPIKFLAKSNLSKNNICSFPNYIWVYGDGTKDLGEDVSHTYKFPGEYNIILNGSCGGEIAVSRTKIKILKPEVSLSLISSGDLEISNLGKTEINIGEWGIMSSSTEFIFPEDTIISASGKMILSKDYSKISLNNNEMINLLDPTHKSVFSLQNIEKENLSNIALNNNQSIGVIVSKKEGDNLTNTFVQNSNKENYTPSSIIKKTAAANELNTNNNSSDPNQKKSEVATALESVKSTESKGFWKSLFGLPMKGIKAIARVFYDVE